MPGRSHQNTILTLSDLKHSFVFSPNDFEAVCLDVLFGHSTHKDDLGLNNHHCGDLTTGTVSRKAGG